MYYPNNNSNYYPGAGLIQPQCGLKGRPVSSIEEVRAAQIDFDGSLFIFPDVANKKIFTKQINLDGTASLKVYTLVEDTPPAPVYITKEEFDAAIKNLELSFKERESRYDESTSKSNSKQSISF